VIRSQWPPCSSRAMGGGPQRSAVTIAWRGHDRLALSDGRTICAREPPAAAPALGPRLPGPCQEARGRGQRAPSSKRSPPIEERQACICNGKYTPGWGVPAMLAIEGQRRGVRQILPRAPLRRPRSSLPCVCPCRATVVKPAPVRSPGLTQPGRTRSPSTQSFSHLSAQSEQFQPREG
jgi:hypothetical protein